MPIATSVARLTSLRAGLSLNRLAAPVLAGGTVAGIAAWIAATNADAHVVRISLARAAIAGVPVAVGVHALRRRGMERVGRLLVAIGCGLLLTTLAESQDPTTYAFARGVGWVMEAAVVYVFLAFPTGRLPARPDRLLAGAMAVVVATLYMPLLLFEQIFPAPTPYGSCVADCPANSLSAFDSEPAFVDALMRPLGILLATAIMAAVVGRLWRRLHEASPLARRMLIPVLAIAGVRVGLAAVGLPLRMLGGEAPQQAPALEVVAWLIALCAPAMALAILAGFWRWDAHAARAVRRLAATLQTRPDPSALRRVMADAFEDSTLQLAFPADGSGQGWKDSAGQAVELPEPGSGRASSEVRSNGEVVAVVIHDEVLCEAPELIDAGTAMAAVVLENASLAAEADWAVQEARSSRRRITAAAERERRRIERDLHDSAQQRLVALRIELELAEELVLTDPERGAARLHELGGDLEETLDELRALAHGVYPPLLADRGLTEALRSATARSAIPVDVDSNDVRRYPPEVESAVYYCVLEAVQNALKHSRAQRIAVHLDGARNASLLLTVRDDGVGTPDGKIQPGAGIANMNERLVTVGGQLEISSTRGAGTVVRGTIPTPAA